MKTQWTKMYGMQQNSSKRKVYSNTSLTQETWKILNKQEITEEIKEEIKKYQETNDNENMTIQSLWDEAKAILRGKLIAIEAYLRNI